MRAHPSVVAQWGRVLLGAVAVTLAAGTVILSHQASPDAQQQVVLGTWHLNLAKSRYTPGPPPQTESRTYRLDADGLKGIIKRTYSDGRSETIEYLANYDRVYPVTGAIGYDAILLKRVDDRTSEATLTHAGKTFGYARRVISADGKTMTISFRSQSDQSTVDYVAVFEKEE